MTSYNFLKNTLFSLISLQLTFPVNSQTQMIINRMPKAEWSDSLRINSLSEKEKLTMLALLTGLHISEYSLADVSNMPTTESPLYK